MSAIWHDFGEVTSVMVTQNKVGEERLSQRDDGGESSAILLCLQGSRLCPSQGGSLLHLASQPSPMASLKVFAVVNA